MFTINIGKSTYRVWFQHEPNVEGMEEGFPPFKGVTTCYLAEVDDEKKVVEEPVFAVAYCSLLDMFERAAGRKTSLTKLLKTLPLNKDVRTQVWEKYFQACKA